MATNTKFIGRFGIGITIIAIFIIVGYVLFFNNYLVHSPQNSTTEYQSDIENKSLEDNEPSPIAKEAEELAKKENITFSSLRSSTLDSMPMNSEPKFVTGEKYTYFVRYPQPIDLNKPGMHPPNVIFNDYRYFNITIRVDGKERINGTECYKISTDGSGEVIVGYVKDERGTRPILGVLIDPFTEYLDAKTGESVDSRTGKIVKGNGGLLEDYKFYAPWMLKLSEGMKWTNFYESKSTGYVGCDETGCHAVKKEQEVKEKEEYEVKEIEIVNKRKCFKVEGRTLRQENNGMWKVTHKKIYWVDVEKRITVKYQLWYQNLQTVEIELINYEK